MSSAASTASGATMAAWRIEPPHVPTSPTATREATGSRSVRSHRCQATTPRTMHAELRHEGGLLGHVGRDRRAEADHDDERQRRDGPRARAPLRRARYGHEHERAGGAQDAQHPQAGDASCP